MLIGKILCLTPLNIESAETGFQSDEIKINAESFIEFSGKAHLS